jgi:hypothetical protein
VNDADLIRLVDALEEHADSYLTLDQVVSAADCDVSDAMEKNVLLVDFRVRADGTAVTLCRLNRRHPLVAEITGW